MYEKLDNVTASVLHNFPKKTSLVSIDTQAGLDEFRPSLTTHKAILDRLKKDLPSGKTIVAVKSAKGYNRPAVGTEVSVDKFPARGEGGAILDGIFQLWYEGEALRHQQDKVLGEQRGINRATREADEIADAYEARMLRKNPNISTEKLNELSGSIWANKFEKERKVTKETIAQKFNTETPKGAQVINYFGFAPTVTTENTNSDEDADGNAEVVIPTPEDSNAG